MWNFSTINCGTVEFFYSSIFFISLKINYLTFGTTLVYWYLNLNFYIMHNFYYSVKESNFYWLIEDRFEPQKGDIVFPLYPVPLDMLKFFSFNVHDCACYILDFPDPRAPKTACLEYLYSVGKIVR